MAILVGYSGLCYPDCWLKGRLGCRLGWHELTVQTTDQEDWMNMSRVGAAARVKPSSMVQLWASVLVLQLPQSIQTQTF